jgi:hypothetical protein
MLNENRFLGTSRGHSKLPIIVRGICVVFYVVSQLGKVLKACAWLSGVRLTAIYFNVY